MSVLSRHEADAPAAGVPVSWQPWDIGTGVTGYVWHATHPRAAVLLLHGYGDYAQRFVDQCHQLIPHLLDMGVSVYAFDLWGSGHSPGMRGATDVQQAINDCHAARRALAEQALPVYLFGHSIGGLVATTSVVADPDGIAGMMLMAPAIKYPLPLPVRALARLGAWLIPGLPGPIPVGNPDALTREPKAQERMANDPVLYHGPIRWLTMGGIATHANRNWEHYPEIRVPVLAIHGTADKVASVEGSKELIAVVASADKTASLIEDGRHCLLDDSAADHVLDVLLRWLGDRLPTPVGQADHTMAAIRSRSVTAAS